MTVKLTQIIMTTLSLIQKSSRVESFSRGAPSASCADWMVPRHGYERQPGSKAAEIEVDQVNISPRDYLRVTMKSIQPFKGFLVKAVQTNCSGRLLMKANKVTQICQLNACNFC